MIVQLLDSTATAEALKNPNVFGLLISLEGTGITREQLAEALVSILALSAGAPAGYLAQAKYSQFRKNFGLEDTLKTLVGWDKIRDTSIGRVRLSLPARKGFRRYFGENNIEPEDSLVAICLLSRDELLEVKNIGLQTITALEGELSKISGLTLVWK